MVPRSKNVSPLNITPFGAVMSRVAPFVKCMLFISTLQAFIVVSSEIVRFDSVENVLPPTPTACHASMTLCAS